MRLSFIKKLIKLVEESDISTLEITRWGTSVRVEKLNSNSSGNSSTVVTRGQNDSTISIPVMSAAQEPYPESIEKKSETASDREYLTVAAPMVGTFYRAPSPDAPPYVEVGDVVSKGQVLCIIEAMKLMNEIQSEVDGTVRKITVENAEPVEFGQELFLIEP